MNRCDVWRTFRESFPSLVGKHLPYHTRVLDNIVHAGITCSPNVLFYGAYGFPLEYFAELFVRRLIGACDQTPSVAAQRAVWDQMIPYAFTDQYFLVDLNHPDMPKDLGCFPDFVKNILESACIHMERHVFILANVDTLCTSKNHFAMRVLLERFSKNAMFVGTTHKIGNIEPPIQSRFMLVRIPLPTSQQCVAIVRDMVSDYVCDKDEKNHCNRNLLHHVASAVLRSDTKATQAAYPSLEDFMRRTQSIEAIRQMSYKLFQAHVTLPLLAEDLAKRMPAKKAATLIHKAAEIDQKYKASSKCRETLYLELLLHYAFLLRSS